MDWGGVVHLSDDIRYPDGPVSHEEEAESWALAMGSIDGYEGRVSEAGFYALTGAHRKVYIRAYWGSGIARRYHDGRISEYEFLFYDPYPGRWGTYWEVLV